MAKNTSVTPPGASPKSKKKAQWKKNEYGPNARKLFSRLRHAVPLKYDKTNIVVPARAGANPKDPFIVPDIEKLEKLPTGIFATKL